MCPTTRIPANGVRVLVGFRNRLQNRLTFSVASRLDVTNPVTSRCSPANSKSVAGVLGHALETFFPRHPFSRDINEWNGSIASMMDSNSLSMAEPFDGSFE